jgi:hypothetical protein
MFDFLDPSLESASQSAHLAWGLALTLLLMVLMAARHLSPEVMRLLFRCACRAAVWVLCGVLVKELLIDPVVEGDPFLWGGARDCAFYLAGVLLGLAALTPRRKKGTP